jgi:hypothetical protein
MGMGWSIGQITLGTVARMCVDDFKGIKDGTARVKLFDKKVFTECKCGESKGRFRQYLNVFFGKEA